LVPLSGWLLYVNQHKLCQITFWPASVALAKIQHWWYVIILIATKWLIVVCCFHLSICCWCWLSVYSLSMRCCCSWQDPTWECDEMMQSYFHFPQWLIVVCSIFLYAVVCCCILLYIVACYCLLLHDWCCSEWILIMHVDDAMHVVDDGCWMLKQWMMHVDNACWCGCWCWWCMSMMKTPCEIPCILTQIVSIINYHG
jgi:hypothetical protein